MRKVTNGCILKDLKEGYKIEQLGICIIVKPAAHGDSVVRVEYVRSGGIVDYYTVLHSPS